MLAEGTQLFIPKMRSTLARGQKFPILIQKIDAERVGGSRSVVTALANRTRQSASLQFGEFLAGVDYSWDKNGNPVLWEANPHYALTRSNLRPEKISSVYRHHDTLLRYYKSLLRSAVAV